MIDGLRFDISQGIIFQIYATSAFTSMGRWRVLRRRLRNARQRLGKVQTQEKGCSNAATNLRHRGASWHGLTFCFCIDFAKIALMNKPK